MPQPCLAASAQPLSIAAGALKIQLASEVTKSYPDCVLDSVQQTKPIRRVMLVPVIVVPLLVLLFPLIARLPSGLKSWGCASNLRQIGRAFELYADEADGRYPLAVDIYDKLQPSTWDQNPRFRNQIPKLPTLSQALDRYAGKGAFRCPADNGSEVFENDFRTTLYAADSLAAKHGSSYLYRTEIGQRSLERKAFRIPHNVNMVFDACGHWHGNVRSVIASDTAEAFALLAADYRYMTLFGDHSVKKLPRSKLQAAWNIRL